MEEFKLEIANRSMRITILSGVKEGFAELYHQLLSGCSDSSSDSESSQSSSQGEYDYIFSVSFEDGTDENKDLPHKNTKKGTRSKNKRLTQADINTRNRLYAKTNKRRAAEFRSLAFLNFRTGDVMLVTLTFDEKKINCKDFDVCRDEFRKFIKRLRGKFRNLVYLGVCSKQDNGNFHYHLLMNLPDDVRNKEIQTVWRLGGTNCSSLYHFDELSNAINYCIKNMMEIAWTDLKGEKAFVHGNGMQKPKVFRSWDKHEKDQAYEYLSRAIHSVLDRPYVNQNSYTTKDKFTDDEITITRMISHISINELFEEPKVAERIKKAPRK